MIKLNRCWINPYRVSYAQMVGDGMLHVYMGSLSHPLVISKEEAPEFLQQLEASLAVAPVSVALSNVGAGYFFDAPGNSGGQH